MFVPHLDMLPIIYGLVIFLGIWSMFRKLAKGRWLALVIEVSVFILVFKLHGGSMNGAFAATIAALLAGLILPRVVGSK